MRVVCHACGADVGARERIGRRDTCARCGAELHSCQQCRFYDARAYNACREPQAERVLDKERGNFCDYFTPLDAEAASGTAPAAAAETSVGTGTAPTGPRSVDARAQLDHLFRRR
jgi:hypothetical protein